jgi:hypothetical protein
MIQPRFFIQLPSAASGQWRMNAKCPILGKIALLFHQKKALSVGK